MNKHKIDHFLDADYRTKFPMVRQFMHQYEVTKKGRIVYHEDITWKLEGTYKKYVFDPKQYDRLLMQGEYD